MILYCIRITQYQHRVWIALVRRMLFCTNLQSTKLIKNQFALGTRRKVCSANVCTLYMMTTHTSIHCTHKLFISLKRRVQGPHTHTTYTSQPHKLQSRGIQTNCGTITRTDSCAVTTKLWERWRGEAGEEFGQVNPGSRRLAEATKLLALRRNSHAVWMESHDVKINCTVEPPF